MSAHKLAELISMSIEEDVHSISIFGRASSDYCSLACDDEDGNSYVIKIVQTNVEAAEDEIDDCVELDVDE